MLKLQRRQRMENQRNRMKVIVHNVNKIKPPLLTTKKKKKDEVGKGFFFLTFYLQWLSHC